MSEIEVVTSFVDSTQAVIVSESIGLAFSSGLLPYSNSSQRKVLGFDWGDASPLLIAEIQGVVNCCEVAIVEEFDVPLLLKVGTAPDYSDVFPELILQQPGIYQQHTVVDFGVVQQVFLEILPGLECSSGKGIVTIDWSQL